MRLTGRRPKRSLEPKDVIMTEVDTEKALEMLQNFSEEVSVAQAAQKRRIWPISQFSHPAVKKLREPLNAIVEYLANSRDKMVVNLLNQFPFTPRRKDLDNIRKTVDEIIARINIPDTNTEND